ncbi:MAG TPA: hypothetical protein QGI71_09415 [Dehalococcoidia bacterium]|jgi:hypothetical protein|nr:hypothetical protein [Dehalococcoidia bacterium]
MQWEYQTHIVDNDGDQFAEFSIDDLNELGDDGWELLHVNKLQDVTTTDADSGEQLTRTKRVVLWFKRPKAA